MKGMGPHAFRPGVARGREIETLVWCGELLPIFEAAPDALGRNKIVKDIDAGDNGSLHHVCALAVRLSIAAAMVIAETCLQGII